tara:strand:+ start:174 stop:278 length:105 start_codon:yes stop_codon:yes gene_type:complete
MNKDIELIKKEFSNYDGDSEKMRSILNDLKKENK